MVSQIILFSQPRSGSKYLSHTPGGFSIYVSSEPTDTSLGHLLERMLTQDQSEVQVLSHPFSASRGKQVPWLLREDYAEGMHADEGREYEDQIQREVEVWETALDEAKVVSLLHSSTFDFLSQTPRLTNANQNKNPLFIHSHPFFPVSPSTILSHLTALLASNSNPANLPASNFTLVPTSLLLHPNTIPLISIRNPRLAVPSTMRVLQRMNLPHGGSRAFLLETTCNVWNVLLYKFYQSHGIEPVVVDAGDFMAGEEFVRALCGRVGLDGGRACFGWKAVTGVQREEMHPMLYASQGTLFESEGVDSGKADLGREEVAWEEEFGDDVGLVREMVGIAGTFYWWLHERRWRGDA
jgi:hypothetical protein